MHRRRHQMVRKSHFTMRINVKVARFIILQLIFIFQIQIIVSLRKLCVIYYIVSSANIIHQSMFTSYMSCLTDHFD